ncbi:MAG: hypothetical protein R3C10_18765 [Pirellulales bacterium]
MLIHAKRSVNTIRHITIGLIASVVLLLSRAAGAPLLHTFHSPTGHSGDAFGNALASDSDRIYVVALGGDAGFANSGTGYGFDRNSFELVAEYRGSQANAYVRHIQSNEDEIFMGSWSATVNGVRRAGIGAIYDAESGRLKYVIENPTPEEDERFGNWAAALGPKEWLIGAYKANDQTYRGGAAFVFDSGQLSTTLFDPTVPEEGRLDRFGFSVASTSDYALVAAYRDSEVIYGAGAVHVFSRSGDYIHSIDNPDPEFSDLFGGSIDAKGRFAIVGAFEDDGPTLDDTGAVFLCNLDTGEILLRIDNPSPTHNRFGYKVAFVGDNIAVGTRDDDDEKGQDGVFIFDGVTGELIDSLSEPRGKRGTYFGFDIASVGTDLVVGAHASNIDGQAGEGAAYLFDGSSWRPAFGDANHDHVIDSLDYLKWSGEYDAVQVRGPADGDFNYDGATDGIDFLLWADAFSDSVHESVPEPNALVLVACAIARIAFVRHR